MQLLKIGASTLNKYKDTGIIYKDIYIYILKIRVINNIYYILYIIYIIYITYIGCKSYKECQEELMIIQMLSSVETK